MHNNPQPLVLMLSSFDHTIIACAYDPSRGMSAALGAANIGLH